MVIGELSSVETPSKSTGGAEFSSSVISSGVTMMVGAANARLVENVPDRRTIKTMIP